MIEYITNEQNQTVIYQTDQIIHMNLFNLSYVKHICMDFLFTHEGYLKAVKRTLGFQYRIPIYIHDALILISTKRMRDDDNIWINYAAISSITYKGNRVVLGFTSHREIEIKMSTLAFKEQIKRISKIKFHISKHFHSVDYRK